MIYREHLDALGEVITTALRGEPPEGDGETTRRVVARLGIHRIREAARQNQVEAMVGVGLRSLGVELDVSWEEAISRNQARVEALIEAAAGVAAGLERAGLGSAAIEAGGVMLGSRLPAAAYCPGDIDLLVEESGWDRVPAILAREGFVHANRRDRPTRRLEFRRRMDDGTEQWIEVGAAPFDRMWVPLRIHDRSQVWLARRVPSPRDSRLAVLRPADALALVSLHTSLHAYVRAPGIRLHTDVDLLVRDNEIDWAQYLAEVEASQFSRRAFVSLSMATGLLGTPVPAGVLDSLFPGPVWGSLQALLSREGALADGLPKLRRARAVMLDALLEERGTMTWLRDLLSPPRAWMEEHFDRGRSGAPLWRLHARRAAQAFTRWHPE